ncbi:DUF262 domain-containing protein [Streptomyces sp. AcH 505]|uniref:GmrSD restriction endonuclease domain-containing protein n=1 Tax=Streptomyces sp. AcH 505 TaxID=352211 RepID=UPI00099C76AC
MSEQSDWDDLDAEEASDEDQVQAEDVDSAVVTDTDWTTETILSQLRRGNIQLNPRFQRRDAWDKPRKSRFIESLLLGLPIPQIVLAEDKNQRGRFIVLDGKQRLLALRQFAANSSLGANDESVKFTTLALTGLDVRADLRRLTLQKLEDDPDRIEDLNSFLNQTIRTVVVRRWPSEQFLQLVFLRLNTGSVRLSPQELRQALHPGPFTDFLDDVSTASSWLQKALRIKNPDFRMRDVEVMLRFFGLHFRINQYTGNLKRFLDDTTNELNQAWEDEEGTIRDAGKSCDLAIDTTFSIFEENSFYRWSPDGYEGRFNRAVFDIMTFYFSQERIRQAVTGRETEVKEAFEDICGTDHQFVESIQTTTKTPEATHRRLEKWGSKLSSVLNIPIDTPNLVNNRLVMRRSS